MAYSGGYFGGYVYRKPWLIPCGSCIDTILAVRTYMVGDLRNG